MLEWSVDNGPHQTSVRLIQVHNQLADHLAVAEGDNARARLESRIGDETWNEAGGQAAAIWQSVPDALRGCVDERFFADGRHPSARYVIGQMEGTLLGAFGDGIVAAGAGLAPRLHHALASLAACSSAFIAKR